MTLKLGPPRSTHLSHSSRERNRLRDRLPTLVMPRSRVAHRRMRIPMRHGVSCRVDGLQVELPDPTEHFGDHARLVFGHVGAEALMDPGQVHLRRGPERALALVGERHANRAPVVRVGGTGDETLVLESVDHRCQAGLRHDNFSGEDSHSHAVPAGVVRVPIVPNVAAVLSAARGAGMPVVYLKMAFKPDLSDAGFPSAPNWLRHAHFHAGDEVTAPNGRPSRILIRDTWNTDIVDELAPRDSDPIVYKSRFSGFYETELDALLKASGIERLIVVGATTSVCVDSTVRDAMFRDYHCLVVEDSIAESIALDAPRSNHEASLLTFELLFAQLSSTAVVVAALGATAPVPA